MLTVKQAAEKAGVTLDTIYKAIRNGKLGHSVVPDLQGRKGFQGYLIDQLDLEKWDNSPNRKKRKKS